MANGLFGTGVQAPSFQTTPIRPTPVPGNTFVRPQQVETGGNLRALADALGGLNAALQNFGSVAAREEKDPNSEANRAFLDSIQGKSPDELRALARQGGLNRIQQDGLNTLLGSKAAYEYRQYLTEAYNTEFDQNTGDFNAWAEAKRQEFAQALPDDASRASFFRATEEWTQRFGEADLKRKVENAVTERDTAVVDEFRMIVDDGLRNGKTPVEIAGAIVQQSGENRDFRGLDGRTQNATIFQLATEYALKGEVEVVRELLNHNRGGVGPLSKTTEYATKSLKLLEDAETVRRQKTDAESYNVRVYIDGKIAQGSLTQAEMRDLKEKNPWISDAQAAAWVDQSNAARQTLVAAQAKEEGRRRAAAISQSQRNEVFAQAFATAEHMGGAFKLKDVEIQGPTGTPVTVTAKEQEAHIIERKLAQFAELEQDLQTRGSSPEQIRSQIMKAKLSWFAANGLMNPEWERPLNSTNVMASIDRIREKGEVTQQLADYAETYREIEAANPAYAAKLLHDERAKEFFESYSEAVLDGATKESALMTASRVSNRTPEERAAAVLPYTEARTLARSMLDADSGFEETPANIAALQDRVQKYMRRGMSRSRAEDKVREDVKTQTFNINGAVVFFNRTLPPDFEELTNRLLEDVVEKYGAEEGIASAYDLTIEPINGETRFAIVRKSDGLPLAGNLTFGGEDLRTYRDLIDKEQGEEKARKNEAARVRGDASRQGFSRGLDGTYRRIWGKKLPGEDAWTIFDAIPDPDGGPTRFVPRLPNQPDRSR
jgi:hypothetical protein